MSTEHQTRVYSTALLATDIFPY